jgi:hypothetical protein
MRNLLLALKKSIINTIYSLLKKNERIIRINSHDNQIKLFFNKKKKLYIKLSNGKFGNECLIREYAGNKWYYNKQGIKYNFVLKKDNFFYEFSRKEIIGYKKNYLQSIDNNFNHLDKCINHYFDIWPKNKYSGFHGDLTLDNILFNYSKEITIIDWECFTEKNVLYGADAVYLLISSIVYPNLKNIKKIKQHELKKFFILWKKILNEKLDKTLINEPVDYFLNLYLANPTMHYITNMSPKKFFPLIISKNDKIFLQKLLQKNYEIN